MPDQTPNRNDVVTTCDIRKLIGQKFDRAAVIEGTDEKGLVRVAFSSELPAERWYGTEILSHAPEAVDLARLRAGGALLVNHDPDDQVGVVESASVDPDRKARALVRFSRSARGQEIAQDVADGIRRLMSVGYEVKAADPIVNSEGERTGYTITQWEPLEISIVAVPVDSTVGVGRSAEAAPPEPVAHTKPAVPEKPSQETRTMPETETTIVVDKSADVLSAERARVKEITAIGTAHQLSELAQRAVESGTSLDAFRQQVLDEMAKRGTLKPAPKADIGMSEKEVKQYSINKAVRAAVLGDWSKAGLELDASNAHRAQNTGQTFRGTFSIPHDVLQSRALTGSYASVGTVGDGGYLRPTDLLAGSFIDLLRNNTVAMQAGTQMMAGLTGVVTIPKMTSGATAYWVAENTDATASKAAFGLVTLSPKNVAAMVPWTRALALQSTPNIEDILRNDITQTLAIAIDLAVFEGAGSGDPTGIANLGGSLNTVAFGGDPSWGKLIDMQTAVATDKVPLNGAVYVGSPAFRGKCLQTERTSTNGIYLMNSPNEVAGYPFLMSTNITNTNLFFGVFSNGMLGMWGGLDLLVDPYTYAASGGVQLVAFQTVDYQVRRDVAFCLSTGMTVS